MLRETQSILVIFMTALSETEDKVHGFGTGAVDYVTKPFQNEEVLVRVKTHITLRNLQNALQEANDRLEQRVEQRTAELREAYAEVEQLKNRLEAENVYLQEEIKVAHNFEEIIGESAAIKEILRQVELVAPTDSTVLIEGETGTGKELIARAIHNLSARRDRPLVKVNCAAISAGLVESELFGHERGAFTGAIQRRIGRFELADGGTLFLDEVGDLPPDTQVKLLRVLQEQEFERVGSSQPIRVDVRVIAATNRHLATLSKDGTFREDLFYRLSVFPLAVPPLRERKADIPTLAHFFLAKFAAKMGKAFDGFSKSSMQQLISNAWPGNVRELQNVIERAVILTKGSTVQIDTSFGLLQECRDPDEVTPESDAQPQAAQTPPSSEAVPSTFTTLEEMERIHIRRVLNSTNWVISGKTGASSILDLHPNTLRSRMQKLGLKKVVDTTHH